MSSASSHVALPTPQRSPTVTGNGSCQRVPIVTMNQPSPLPPSSPAVCSTATTHTAELLNWNEGSTVAPAMKASLPTADASEISTPNENLILEGACAVIMSLVFQGDHHWEVTHPRRCKSQAAKSNIQHTITGMMLSLRNAGLLSDEVATTVVVYLRRLSAKHVKFVSRFTIKKYICAACVVANKTCSDQYYNLDCYSEATGIGKSAIADSELQFLETIEYDVQIGLTSPGALVASSFGDDQSATYPGTSMLLHDMALAATSTTTLAKCQPSCDETLSTAGDVLPDGAQNTAPVVGIAAIVESILSTVETSLF